MSVRQSQAGAGVARWFCRHESINCSFHDWKRTSVSEREQGPRVSEWVGGEKKAEEQWEGAAWARAGGDCETAARVLLLRGSGTVAAGHWPR